MLNSLPDGLRSALVDLARTYRARGADLFVFGSFGRGEELPGSDLDLGVEWRVPCSPALFRELSDDVENLPTIRKIDLVDFASMSPRWKQIALRDRQPLIEG